MSGSLLMWSAFPPLGWSWLAWVAPVAWLLLIRMPALTGRHPYRVLWVAGLVHWLLVVHWVRLPHWSTIFGWWALAMYLALYVPLFIALARFAVHRLRVSVLLAAPVIWTGLELFRGHLLTGFSMALLAHTQVENQSIIQVSDLTGAYGVSFLLMFTAAGLARMVPVEGWKWRVWPLIPVVALIAAVCAYGLSRNSVPLEESQPATDVHVALVQGSVDVTFDQYDPIEAVNHYLELSRTALARHPDLDAMVWPESMCTFLAPLVTYNQRAALRPDVKRWADANTAVFRQRLRMLLEEHRRARSAKLESQGMDLPSFIVCSATYQLEREIRQFNTGLMIGPQGQIEARYDKMHPVMFGEYLPLGQWCPWIYDLTPIGAGLSAGDRAVPFRIKGLVFCPSICFESTVPHLIRGQIMQLTHDGTPPDVLVNLTNDGWFWGSSELDLHLACGVFRAVENRLPLLIAANTGFSAWIDAMGQIIERGPRRATGVIVARISANPAERSTSFYRQYGDLFAGICLLATAMVTLLGISARFRLRRKA